MPAVVTEDPLGIAAEFSDGTTCVLKVDAVRAGNRRVVSKNPALARELLLGLADLVHPHGDINADRTLRGYLTGIRNLTNGLAERGFTGTCSDLTRAQLAAHWRLGDGRPQHEGQTRGMLRRVDDLHGLLKPDVRDLVDGRKFKTTNKSDLKNLPPYSETEWARITEVSLSVVKESYRAHQRAKAAAEGGEDPFQGGWTAANLLWAYTQRGPDEVGPLAMWSSAHPSGLSRAKFPFMRTTAAGGLFPDAATVIAYRLLLGVYTGIVPDGLDDLGLGDVDWAGDATVLLSYVKGRTAGESRTLTRRASRLLEQWTDHSALTRRFAPPHLRDRLWLRYELRGRHDNWQTTVPDSITIRRWIVVQGLLGDDGKPLQIHLHRIRTTYDSLRDRRSWMGSRRATLDPNRSPATEGDHYLGAHTVEQRELVEEIIAEAQNDMLRRAEPPTVLVTEDVATLVQDYPRKVAALGLDDEALAALVGGQRDVFSAACGDQLSGLHGPKGKPCPARPWVCLLCPLALFTPRHLPNLMRLRAYFARQWDQMTGQEFLGVFGHYDRRLTEILTPGAYFTSGALLEAAGAVADIDDELPLRPEEGTR
ncbi:hypothetical protein OG389_21165 [Streptomyces sp. NBC_00435]|uniref:hypothetical protein n=1 Tax=Streptomyces sp. NBC_00435 TaxID=2903649 RepID=UPI002E22C3D4